MCDLAPEEQAEYFRWLELASLRSKAPGAPRRELPVYFPSREIASTTT
ncbi:MAG TPA: hypothetical protein VK424_03770 [Thermoplasmata archaeon]|nr:hypothetical protein [Thermoplasmata archaeon]